jgi:hypothetical protein
LSSGGEKNRGRESEGESFAFSFSIFRSITNNDVFRANHGGRENWRGTEGMVDIFEIVIIAQCSPFIIFLRRNEGTRCGFGYFRWYGVVVFRVDFPVFLSFFFSCQTKICGNNGQYDNGVRHLIVVGRVSVFIRQMVNEIHR